MKEQPGAPTGDNDITCVLYINFMNSKKDAMS